MPLGARDFLLVLRARDEASRIVTNLGRTLGGLSQHSRNLLTTGAVVSSIGVGLGIVGVAGVRAFADLADAAADYSLSAAKTLTQIDGIGVGLEELKDIGRDVANAIPAPFEQMQDSLFDIFSSMDVNAEQARHTLTQFSKAAVAGQTDIQTAGRASISIMNGFGKTTEDLSDIMDVQFQLVRKGVGDYEEFATSIGKSIPSARRAGQSVETLAGMLAFMTRNGLSAAMASTSAARAFDALSHPTTVGRLEDMGIVVKDASDEFLSMSDIMQQLSDKLGHLTAPARAQALQDLFKGSGGTIQARRFFDLAITGFDDLQKRIDEMIASGGSMTAAYDIMFNQPATQAQLLKNRIATLRTELGDMLLPTLNRLIEAGIRVVQWFRDLPDGVQKAIVIFGALASVAAVIVGVLATIAGIVIMLKVAFGLLAPIIIGAKVALLGFNAVMAAGVWGAIIGAVGILTFKWLKMVDAFGAGDKKAKAWAKSLTEVYDKTTLLGQTKAYTTLSQKVSELSKRKQELKDKITAAQEALQTSSPEFNKMQQQYARISTNLKAVTKELKEQQPQFDSLRQNWLAVNDVVSISQEHFDWLSSHLGLDFTKGLQASEGARQKMIDHLLGIENATNLSMAALEALGDGTPQITEQIAEAIGKFQDEVSKSFSAANNIIGDLGDKVGSTAAEITKWYQDHLKSSQEFANNIRTAVEQGYDPQLIARILEAGPAEAGPLLQSLVKNHSKTLVDMVNQSEKALLELNTLTVQMGRLTQMALMATTDQMAKDLPIAMAIVQHQFKSGGEKSVAELAAALGVGVDKVSQVVSQYGITTKEVLQAHPGPAEGGAAVGDAVVSSVRAAEHRMEEAGRALAQGVIVGLAQKRRELEAAAAAAGVAVSAAMKRQMDMSSPSRVMMKIGRDIASGLAIGIEDGTNRYVTSAAIGMADGSASGFPVRSAGGGGTSITVAPGAIQISLAGDVSADTVRQVRGAVMDALEEVFDEHRTR